MQFYPAVFRSEHAMGVESDVRARHAVPLPIRDFSTGAASNTPTVNPARQPHGLAGE